MTLQPQNEFSIPEETARIARAVYPKGNTFMKMRDALGTIYQDQSFAHLFPSTGRPVEAPWHLTETCEQDAPHLITHVATTAATTTDEAMTETIHAELSRASLTPRQHLLDTGYITAPILVSRRASVRDRSDWSGSWRCQVASQH